MQFAHIRTHRVSLNDTHALTVLSLQCNLTAKRGTTDPQSK